MYQGYIERLNTGAVQTDFSLLQKKALQLLENNCAACETFKHVVIDEYQDTNAVQERIFFKLASVNQNLCVVGDDEQALYRFRGATVENFVEFPERCQKYLIVFRTKFCSIRIIVRARESLIFTRALWNFTTGDAPTAKASIA